MQLKKFRDDAKEAPNMASKEKDKISAHFKQVCSFYDSAIAYTKTSPSFHIGYDYATQELIALALRYVDFDGKRLLEIGCGLGSTLIYLSKRFNMSCVGIDLNPAQIDVCKERIISCGLSDRITVQQTNALNIDTRGGAYDIVWSEDSFSHIPGRGLLLKRIREVLKKSGILVLSDLVKTEKIGTRDLDAQQEAWCLWSIETYGSYLNMIQEAGLKLLNYTVDLGKTLLEYHINRDMANGDLDPDMYLEILRDNKKQLISDWGEFNYNRRFERLRTYRYIKEGKLDYNFFVALKE